LQKISVARAHVRRFYGLLLAVCCVCLLTSCDRILGSAIDDEPLIEEEGFRRAKGHKLHYDVYLPSTWAGWVHQDHCLFRYNPETESYLLENIIIGQKEVDYLGSRFKISSQDWRYQFGFGHHGVSLNESTIGIDMDGVVARLRFSTGGRSDMRVEYDEKAYDSMIGKILSFELKILDESSKPESLLMIRVKDPSEISPIWADQLGG